MKKVLKNAILTMFCLVLSLSLWGLGDNNEVIAAEITDSVSVIEEGYEPNPDLISYYGYSISYNLYSDQTAKVKRIIRNIGGEFGVDIPQTIEKDDVTYIVNGIEQGAFSMSALTKVTIPNSFTCIGERAFAGAIDLNKVVIPDSVTRIERCAFERCEELESISLPDSIEFIDSYALAYSGLKEVYIPKGVIEIGEGAFCGCNNLSKYNVDSLNSVYRVEGNALIENSTNKLIAGCSSTIIPQGIEIIAKDAFWECEELSELVIPESVKRIKTRAFGRCNGLKSVSIPDGVEIIEDGAFDSCENIKNVIIPKSVSQMEIPFNGCSGIERIIVDDNNANYKSEGNAVIEKSTNKLLFGCNNTVIPVGVTTIGVGAFYNCIGLTSIVIPSTVTSIEACTFWNCTSLKSVEIPNSIRSIGASAFRGTSSLENLYIPCSVENIDLDAFGSSGENQLDMTVYVAPNSAADIFFSNNAIEGITVNRNGTHNIVEGICTDCGKCEDVIATGNHIFKDIVKPDVAEQIIEKETCGNKGKYYKICSECGALSTEIFEVDALPHQAIEFIPAISATCHETGMEAYYQCNDCNNIYKDEACENQTTLDALVTDIDQNNHDGETVLRGEVVETCTEEGYTGDVYCLGCGKVKEKGQVIHATGHKKDAGIVIKQPTETDAGKKLFKCSVCGVSLGEEEIP